MDHNYIEDEDLIRLYSIGSLAGTDQEIFFEVHFVDCAECVDQLVITRAFIEGLSAIAGERNDAMMH